MEETIQKQNDYSNITAWHRAGIDGKGVVVWDCESASEHGKTTRNRVLHSAPASTVLVTSAECKFSNKEVIYAEVTVDGEKMSIEDFIVKNNIKILTKSVGGGTAEGLAESKFWNDLKEKYNLIFFNSAGNDGEEGCGGAFPPDVAIYVGACTLSDKGKVNRAGYSAVGKQLDFMTFTGVWSGTSFAAPYLAGMAALLVQKNPSITQEEVYEYFKEHSMDFGDEGRDNYYGEGVVIMGEPITKTQIRLPINKEVMYVNGTEKRIDQPAVIDTTTNRTLVPVRAIAEAFGATVEWDNKNREVLIEL